MTLEQMKYILRNRLYHNSDVFKQLLKQIDKDSIDMMRENAEKEIKCILSDDELLTDFVNKYNVREIKRKLRCYNSLDVEEKLCVDEALEKLKFSDKYLLLEIFYVGRTIKDVSEELNLNRNTVSKKVDNAINEFLEVLNDE